MTGPLVLIVEDEALVALMIEEILVEAGFRVCGPADRPDEALAIARAHRPDLAVIDVRLADGGDGILLAEALAQMGPLGMLFATGNPGEVQRRATVGQACLAKPFEANWLIGALKALAEGRVANATIPGFFALPWEGGP